MKKLTVAAAALASSAGAVFAADIPIQPVRIEEAILPSWSGVYVGLNAGGTYGDNSAANLQGWNLSKPSNAAMTLAALISGFSSSASGKAVFIGGGQIGYNWQEAVGSYTFVTGVEADIQGMTNAGTAAGRWSAANTDYFGQPVSLLSGQIANLNISYVGTARGRLGISFAPALLIYGSGGLAYGGVNADIQNAQLWITTGGPKAGYNSFILGSGSSAKTKVGWTAGGGVEWMFMANWSAKAEYLYYDLGKLNEFVVSNYYGTGGFAGNNGVQNLTRYMTRASGNIIRAGVNYHFNFAGSEPIAAKF
jgi:outer membrane immunogenic protein